MNSITTHSSHANLDMHSRRHKVEKILAVLGINEYSNQKMKVLEIGTGSGAIAHLLATAYLPNAKVHAVDVSDQRLCKDGYEFCLVDGAALPYLNDSFDLVISNHVLEHVGGAEIQEIHLSEIRRVMAPNADAYLATPNRWQIVEPHFRLAFLSWLPGSARSWYLRMSGKGRVYDCYPRSYRELTRLIAAAGLSARSAVPQALDAWLAIEPVNPLYKCLSFIPKPVLNLMVALSPTHVMVLKKA